MLIEFEHCHKCALRHLHGSYLAHSLLALLLLFEQFALTRDITSITLGCNILANLLNCLTGNDFGAYCSLNRNIELLARDEVLQLDTHLAAEIIGIVLVDEG